MRGETTEKMIKQLIIFFSIFFSEVLGKFQIHLPPCNILWQRVEIYIYRGGSRILKGGRGGVLNFATNSKGHSIDWSNTT